MIGIRKRHYGRHRDDALHETHLDPQLDVRHISGLDDAFDPVPSSLRTYNAKLTKEEVEAENLRLRLRGLKPAGGDDDDGLPRVQNPKVPATKKPYKSKKGDGGLAPPS